MSNQLKRALLLSGSPKGKRGASWKLGCYLCDRLEQAGVETRRRAIMPATSDNDPLADIAWTELVVLSFPLYADAVPSVLMKAMKKIEAAKPGPKFLAVICNSGFAEANQNTVAIDVCRRFSAATGWKWLGGIGRGAGAMLAGKTMENIGSVFAPVRKALDDAASPLARGEELPADIIATAECKLMPYFFYMLMGSIGMLQHLYKNGQLWRYRDRPYERESDPGFE